jgi:FdhD protein
MGHVRRAAWIGGAATVDHDALAREEPLEIRIGGVPVAVVMRTPGHDEELVRGFLWTEQIVTDPRDVSSIRHCPVVDVPEAEENVVQVVLAPHVEVDLAGLRRQFYATSSCGICGKTSIAQALRTAPPVVDPCRVSCAALYALPPRLFGAQDVFHKTGGLHAAGLFDLCGNARAVYEDVGRHNAVDKVVGWAASQGLLPLEGHILLISGRASFEVVQKALAARIPIVAAVSAPSSLAVELARKAGLTVIGFLRGDRMCVYSGEARVEAERS